MRKLMLRLRAHRDGSRLSSVFAKVEAEGVAAYAGGASERDCPYRDKERSAAWSHGYRRADRMDASVW